MMLILVMYVNHMRAMCVQLLDKPCRRADQSYYAVLAERLTKPFWRSRYDRQLIEGKAEAHRLSPAPLLAGWLFVVFPVPGHRPLRPLP